MPGDYDARDNQCRNSVPTAATIGDSSELLMKSTFQFTMSALILASKPWSMRSYAIGTYNWLEFLSVPSKNE